MKQTDVTHIILDPKSPRDARVLYAAGFGTGRVEIHRRRQVLDLEEQRHQGRRALRVAARHRRQRRRSTSSSRAGATTAASATTRTAPSTAPPTAPKAGAQVRCPSRASTAPTASPSTPTIQTVSTSPAGAATPRAAARTAASGSRPTPARPGRIRSTKNEYCYDVTIDPTNPNTLFTCGFESSRLPQSTTVARLGGASRASTSNGATASSWTR